MTNKRAYRVVAILGGVTAVAAGALFAAALLGPVAPPLQNVAVVLLVIAVALIVTALIIRARPEN